MPLRGGRCGTDGRASRAARNPCAAAFVLLTLANEAWMASTAWCAGLGTFGDGGERCPPNDAAGPCPPGCEVAAAPDDSGGEDVAIGASVVVVLAVAIAIVYIYIDLRPGLLSSLHSSPGRTSPSRSSLSVDNPLTKQDDGDSDDDIDAE
eukprot:COSAG02_NODE_360_length_23829_cov_107.112769_9_plen_150_part_00